MNHTNKEVLTILRQLLTDQEAARAKGTYIKNVQQWFDKSGFKKN